MHSFAATPRVAPPAKANASSPPAAKPIRKPTLDLPRAAIAAPWNATLPNANIVVLSQSCHGTVGSGRQSANPIRIK